MTEAPEERAATNHLLAAAAHLVLAVSRRNRRTGHTHTVTVPRKDLLALEAAVERVAPGLLDQFDAEASP